MVNAINPLNSLQPNVNQNLALPADAFPGQRKEKGNDIPRLVIDRRQKASSAREEIPREEVERAMDKLNRLMNLVEKRRKVQLDEKSHPLRIKIIDENTNQVLEEISPQRLMDILGTFSEAVGIQVDKRV